MPIPCAVRERACSLHLRCQFSALHIQLHDLRCGRAIQRERERFEYTPSVLQISRANVDFRSTTAGGTEIDSGIQALEGDAGMADAVAPHACLHDRVCECAAEIAASVQLAAATLREQAKVFRIDREPQMDLARDA